MEATSVDFQANQIHVHDDEGEDAIVLHLFLAGQLHSMNRPRFEKFSKTLKRLLTAIQKKSAIKSPKKKTSHKIKVTSRNVPDNSLLADLNLENDVNDRIIVKYPNQTIAEVEVLNNEDIISGMFFAHESMFFTFIRNPPTIIALQLYPKSYVMIDYPIVPTVTSKFSDGVVCEWYCELQNKEIIFVSNEFFYTPGPDTLGCKLKMFCTPWRWAQKESYHQNENIDENVENKDNGKVVHKQVSEIKLHVDEDHVNQGRMKETGRTAVCYVSSFVQAAALGSKILEVRKAFNEMDKEEIEINYGHAHCKRAIDVETDYGGNKSENNNNNRYKNNTNINNTNIRNDDNNDNNSSSSSSSSSSNMLLVNEEPPADISTLDLDFSPDPLLFNNLSLSISLSQHRSEGQTDSDHNPYIQEKIKEEKQNINNLSSNLRKLNDLRIMTFNILAEPFAISNHAINKIYSYCPVEYLETEYRAQLIFKELISYDADILSLQECDYKTFQFYLKPLLSSYGYELHYTNKAAGVLEGCVSITKKKKIEILRRVDLPLKNVLRNAPYLQGIYSVRPDLQDVMGGKLGTVGQITVCRCREEIKEGSSTSRILILANTHLFYHPAAGFARLLQTDAIVRTVLHIRNEILSNGLKCIKGAIIDGEDLQAVSDEEDISTEYTKFGNDVDKEYKKERNLVEECSCHAEEYSCGKISSSLVSAIIMGDFNSTPETAVIEYLEKGCILEQDVWESINDFHWGMRQSEGDNGIPIGNTVVSPKKAFDIDSDSGSNRGSESDSATFSFMTSNPNVAPNPTYLTPTLSSTSSSRNPTRQEIRSEPTPTYLKLATENSGISLPNLTHDLNLFSAAGYPLFTNFTKNFKDILDYIFIQKDHFNVLRVAPFPSDSVLSENVALPSHVFPSDHLAVVVDIQFIR